MYPSLLIVAVAAASCVSATGLLTGGPKGVPGVANITAPVTNLTSNITAPIANLTAPQGNMTGASGNGPTGVCTRTCVRKEWRSMSSQERSAFLAAVRTLMSGAAPTRYDALVKYHIDAQTFSHGTPYFLPWHRAYLRHFEQQLQSVDPSVCLPYWNWALDSQAPEYAPVFTNEYFGTSTSGCVTGGFGAYQAYYPSPHCVSRQYAGGDNLGSFHSVEGVNRVVTSSRDYDTFRQRTESILHPVVHQNIGGDMNQMSSPNDPIFWLHHGYVDYMWSTWQKRNGYDFSGQNANRNAQCQGLPYTVDQVMDHGKLCYDYADLADTDLADDALPPPRVSKPPGSSRPDMVNVVSLPDDHQRSNPRDRTNLNSIRYPDQIGDAWCQMNRIDISSVRNYEDEYRGIYRQLNNIKGYTSPCCLWKRPSLCRGLVGKTKQFCVDVPGYGRMEIGYSDSDPMQCMSNVRQRAQYTSSDVELPPEQYRSQVQKLVGASAFDGAGTMKPITDMDGLGAGSKQVASAMAVGAAVAAVVAFTS